MYRVYDKRTGETLFEAGNNIDCALWMGKHIGVESEDFQHVWLEKVESDVGKETSG